MKKTTKIALILLGFLLLPAAVGALREKGRDSESNLLSRTLDFNKAWAIYEPFDGDIFLTCYAFTEAGEVYCGVGPDRSMWLGFYSGSYAVTGDEVTIRLASLEDYTYRFDPQTLRFVQISENGFFYTHAPGETLQLQEYEWKTAEEMIALVKDPPSETE